MPEHPAENTSESVAAHVEREVGAWPGVSVVPHRFGGREFRVAHHEIGHLHGDRLADLPFPVRVRRELVAAGQAEPHHVLPDSGWVSRRIRSAADVPAVVALFRLNYDRLVAAAARTAGGAPPDDADDAAATPAEARSADA